MADLTQIARDTGNSLGRYFSVVSALPSLLLVAWTYLLAASGALTTTPSPARAATAISGLSVAGLGALVLSSLAVGVVLHPLQFAFVQLMEGYWGVSEIAQRWRVERVLRHHRRLVKLRETAQYAEDRLERVDALEEDYATLGVEVEGVERLLEGERARWTTLRAESLRLASEKPWELDETLPTRLGNTLRYHERSAGASYGLDAVRVMPYISRVAPPGDMEYVNDQRSQLDLATRTMIVAIIAFLLTAASLATDGVWLLAALIPYGAAYLSYRGAVVAAGEYGRALAVVIALNRFALYDRMRMRAPSSTREERADNAVLSRLLAHGTSDSVSISYYGSDPPRPPSP